MTDDDALVALAQEKVAPSIRSDILEIFDALAAAVPPEPHWHLAFIGVDPMAQGRGIGGALLRHVLPLVDEQGSQAYLESTNPRNVSLYERFGFGATQEIRIGSAPPLYPMVRPARRGAPVHAPAR